MTCPLLSLLLQMDRFANEWNLVQRDIRVMLLLRDSGPHGLTDACQRLRVAPQTMSRIVKKLIERGFVSVDVSRWDRRRTTMSLTPIGMVRAGEIDRQ